jgi:hypothetical protein
MRTRIHRSLCSLAVGALVLGAIALTAIALAGCGVSTAAAPQPNRTEASDASVVPGGTASTPIMEDARLDELMANWTVTVPVGVDVHDYDFVTGSDGRFRRASLTAKNAPEGAAKDWVAVVAAEWGVTPTQEEGNGYWAAWLPDVGRVRAPVDGDTVRFTYIASSEGAEFTLPVGWDADGWDVPPPPDAGFTEARLTRTATSDRFEFVDAPASQSGVIAAYLAALAGDGWKIVDERTAVTDAAELEWHTENDLLNLTVTRDVPSRNPE